MMQAGQQSKRMISALEHIVYILNIEQDTVLKKKWLKSFYQVYFL